MHTTTAVIPVYFAAEQHVELTDSIVRKVLNEKIAKLYIILNGGTGSHLKKGKKMIKEYLNKNRDRLTLIEAPNNNIYEMWNMGWKAALDDYGDEVLIAFLNNDIDFLPATLEVLAKAVLKNEIWVTYPDSNCSVENGARVTGRTIPTRGSKCHGGMTGHCFLLKGGIHTKAGFPLFDTRYQCWYGDDDFAFRVEQYGFQIHRVEGLPCNHLNEATVQYRPDVAVKRDEDHSLFISQWRDIDCVATSYMVSSQLARLF